jgi:hypothetical protein
LIENNDPIIHSSNNPERKHMAGSRKNQSAAAYFGTVLKVVLLCSVVCGASVGYVWQKSRIIQLGQEIRQRDLRLKQLRAENLNLAHQRDILQLTPLLDKRVKELNLGLVPTSPAQVVRLPEPSVPPGRENSTRRFAAAGGRTDAVK